ncbi:hypothetical protein [Frankia sp. Cas3]|uniref:hypothetical protein n=1 Tax=Frankia sp. Cas3 TaxID=3073926 RepID=UPI002AD353A5|nr:hypothetical protein [Frankia sp. Cas3]
MVSYDHSAQRNKRFSGGLAARARTFNEWTADLRAAGFWLCPASCGVPVELRGLRPDGFGFHLRCRGVRVTLSLFCPGRAMWQLPHWDPRWTPEEGLSLWVNHPIDHPSSGYRTFGSRVLSASDPGGDACGGDACGSGSRRPSVVPDPSAVPDRARMVFDREEAPDHQVLFDGGRECGWRGHEAGLLRPAAAATLFAWLMAEADAARGAGPAVVRVPRARAGEAPLAPVRTS